MNASVVLRVRNGAALIGRQLRCLAGQDYGGEWEVVVVDNGSTDGTTEIAASWADRLPLRVVDATEARGAAAIANAAVKAASAPLVLICDHDDLVCPSWVTEMVAVLGEHQLAGGATAIAREPLVLQAPVTYPKALPVHRGFLPYTFLANMGLRRDLFDELNGFDPLMSGAEDVDFCFRSQLAGSTLGFAPRAQVLKGSRGSGSGRFQQHYAFGRADVALDRRYRSRGLRNVYPVAARQVAWLLTRAPGAVVSEQCRFEWAGVAGRVVGVAAATANLGVGHRIARAS